MSDEIRFGVSELADAAGVSVRTVRYYITEGLLPPPVTAGAKSYYTGAHRDRLVVIGRLKDAYLPLREIRRQLAELDDDAIHDMAETTVKRYDLPDVEFSLFGSEFDGIHEEQIHDYSAPMSPPAASAPQESPPAPHGDSASDYIGRLIKRAPHRRARDHHQTTVPSALPSPLPGETAHGESEPAAWRRIVISDDVELLVRDETYHRRREKVTWLVDWAKRVFS